jgi:outer membrane receptor protein involved in Fe transport
LSTSAAVTAHGAPGGDLAASLNIPIVRDTAGLRIVAYRSEEGGYIDDLRRKLSDINAVHITGGRVSARGELNGWTVDLGGLAQKIRGDDAQFSNRPSNPLTTESFLPQNYSNNYALANVTVRREQPLLIVLTGTVSRQSLREHYDASTAERPILFAQHTKGEVDSFEARVSRETTRHSGWLAGISAVRNDYQQTRRLDLPNSEVEILPGLHNRQTEVAVFGELTRPLFGGIDVTAGARAALSEIAGEVLNARRRTATETRKQNLFLPSIAFSARPARALMLYARYQQGFRAGGFSIFADVVQRYRADRMSAFELGGRYAASDAWQPRIDVALAYTRWSNIQADTLDIRGFPATVTAGDGKIYTASVQLSWKLSRLFEIETAAVFNESHLTNPAETFSQSVLAPLPNVPRLNARIGGRFTRSLPRSRELSVFGSMRYVGKSRLGVGPILGREQGGWLEADTGATLISGAQGLSLSITNLFGVVGNRFAFGSPFTMGQVQQITPLRPRTVRIAWDFNF